jgi:TonB family protein
MKRLQDEREEPRLLIDSFRSDTTRLLKTGIITLLLHIAFLAFLSFSLKSATATGEPPIYRVTIRPVLPLLAKTQIQKEKKKSMQEVKQEVSVLNKKKIEQGTPPSAQPAIIKIPLENQKQLPKGQEKEETVKEPIPLPIAAVSPLNTDLILEVENNLPLLLSSSDHREQDQNTIPDIRSVEGRGTGHEGSGWGAGDGLELGRGGSGWKGFQKGAEFGHGGSGLEGSGNRSGLGKRGSGWGAFGNGGIAVPHPRYAGNPKPVYPQEAREKGYGGEVLLRVEVLSNGRAGQVEVKKSSGHEVLDQSALATVKQWKFNPARKGGIPIPFWVNLPIKFQLL